MSEKANTKEYVLQRMYNHAASFWGVQSIEDLDPLVKLIMQGFASNLYDLHNEVEDLRVRLLESLATVLTPSILVNARPSHAIAQAYPYEPAACVDRKTVLLDKKVSPELQQRGIKSFSFVPVSRVRLISGKINSLIAERIFYKIEPNGEKVFIASANTPGEKTNYTVWIGLDLHPELETLQGLSFYVDFPISADKYNKYKVLPYSRWSVNVNGRMQPLEMQAGLPSLPDENEEEMTDYDFIIHKYNPLNRIDENITALYRMQYLTVNSGIKLKSISKETLPSEIKDLFPEHVSLSAEPCCWIKAVFPVYITPKDIQDIRIEINTFPVANKTPYSCTHNTGERLIGIVPLPVGGEEHFLSVDKVSDSHGVEYKPVPYTSDGKPEAGFYSIRRGGVERFDRRNANEAIERMINQIRDEYSSFVSMDVDSIRNIISKMQEELKQIESKHDISSMYEHAIPYYLLLNRIEKEEILYVDYWATHGELANGLRAGKMLTPITGAVLQKDSCRLLSPTKGGKYGANVMGRLDAFRYVLASRDRIVTFEDAANFCRLELGGKIIGVHISRGIAVSPKPKEGLVRTIDVHLTPTPSCEAIVGEMEADLLTMLHSKSPDTFNYRIIIEKTKR